MTIHYFLKTVSTILSEGVIGEFITNVQNKYKDLDIGSYPYFKKKILLAYQSL